MIKQPESEPNIENVESIGFGFRLDSLPNMGTKFFRTKKMDGSKYVDLFHNYTSVENPQRFNWIHCAFGCISVDIYWKKNKHLFT